MIQEEQLKSRSGNQCEMCASGNGLKTYVLPQTPAGIKDDAVYLCGKCLVQVEKQEEPDHAHWQCLGTAMWSEVPAVQVLAWRMLSRMRQESWAQEKLDMMYLDDETLAWARAAGDADNDGTVDLHRDCNGNQLRNDDTVVLTKSLDVKGTSLNAKMGTVVKNIRLVPDNTEQIEGKIEGQLIVILTKYIRKQG
ncbi:PhnA domain-containing protein [Chitinophaga sp. GCM10012297]|uniref:PhnA domain-containing protein n=1 Tax=Chitinophaga chungangae TaxID=2821488 RepID=A0ABS3YBR2_9BACT|nr:alkylphosphonate utilization protein [Chitinophaga chungangae]MBO9152117.1 PhnA domain-containing protein [Chitinophaga chungangae]